MAADGTTSGGEAACDVHKMFRVRGFLIGFTGPLADCRTALRIIRNTPRTDPRRALSFMTKPLCEIQNFDASELETLFLCPEGIWVGEGLKEAWKADGPFMAIGSGAQGAMVALHLGLSPREAVRIASRVDPNSGGRVRTLSLP